MPSDCDVVKRIRKGRTQEFRLLIERYHGSGFALAYHVLARREDAEDAVQEAFVKAFQSLQAYDEGRPFWPWFRRIVVNCCLNTRTREIASGDADSLADSDIPAEDTIESDLIRKCEMEDVLAAIAELPMDYRTVVVLRFMDDLSTPEIAEMLGVQVGTVRVRLHRAIKMLAHKLAVVKDEV